VTPKQYQVFHTFSMDSLQFDIIKIYWIIKRVIIVSGYFNEFGRVLTFKRLYPFSIFGTFLLILLKKMSFIVIPWNWSFKNGCLFNIQLLHWMNVKRGGRNSACKPFVQRPKYERRSVSRLIIRTLGNMSDFKEAIKKRFPKLWTGIVLARVFSN